MSLRPALSIAQASARKIYVPFRCIREAFLSRRALRGFSLSLDSISKGDAGWLSTIESAIFGGSWFAPGGGTMFGRKTQNSRLAGFVCAVAALTSCTQTLPAPEAGAFRTIATLSRDEFTQRVDREYQAQIANVARELRANRGRVVVAGCGSQDQIDCTVTYTDGPLSMSLVSAAPKARALIGSIANYGNRMAELAEAKDLEELRTKAEAASGAAKALALVVMPAGPIAGMVAPLLDAAFWAANARRIDRRRRALLEIATATQPAIDQAAATLTAITRPLRETSVDEIALRLNATKNAITLGQVQERSLRKKAAARPGQSSSARLINTADRIRDQRAVDFQTLMHQQAELNAARAPGLDYQKLADAHRKLREKLANPRVSLENAMRDLDFLIATASAAATATRPTPAS